MASLQCYVFWFAKLEDATDQAKLMKHEGFN